MCSPTRRGSPSHRPSSAGRSSGCSPSSSRTRALPSSSSSASPTDSLVKSASLLTLPATPSRAEQIVRRRSVVVVPARLSSRPCVAAGPEVSRRRRRASCAACVGREGRARVLTRRGHRAARVRPRRRLVGARGERRDGSDPSSSLRCAARARTPTTQLTALPPAVASPVQVRALCRGLQLEPRAHAPRLGARRRVRRTRARHACSVRRSFVRSCIGSFTRSFARRSSTRARVGWEAKGVRRSRVVVLGGFALRVALRRAHSLIV